MSSDDRKTTNKFTLKNIGLIILVILIGKFVSSIITGGHKSKNIDKSGVVEKALLEMGSTLSPQLPKMVDPSTRLDSVVATKKSLLSKYTLVSAKKADIDVESFKKRNAFIVGNEPMWESKNERIIGFRGDMEI